MRSLTLLHSELSTAKRYGLAMTIFLAALLLRLALLPLIDGFPYSTLFPATVAESPDRSIPGAIACNRASDRASRSPRFPVAKA